ncbi:MAG: metalloregulator ArsR/SmtB family transcription factor [Clostridia bacterium]
MTSIPICDASHVDENVIEREKKRIPSEDDAIDIAEVFALLGSPVKIRLLSMLSHSEMCVCTMAEILGISQPNVSHHLRSLRQNGVVRFKRSGKRAVYYISNEKNGVMIRRIIEDIILIEENFDHGEA